MSAHITIVVNGHALRVTEGCTVATAFLNEGRSAFRASVSGEPRGPLCGMGTCHECRVSIDGISHQRACMVPATDGMVIECDV